MTLSVVVEMSSAGLSVTVRMSFMECTMSGAVGFAKSRELDK